ncbi:proprotein convertase P-domain-containing protein, partial [bacterium]|nr:proprotein convertase P-domain-containing protein [bacterium]
MRVAPWVVVALVLMVAVCPARTIVFEENVGQGGLAVDELSGSHVKLAYRLEKISINDIDVDGETMQQVSISGLMLPNDEGAPNLPGIGRLIAVPEGATPRLEIVSFATEIIRDIDIVPAHNIPLESDDSPLLYVKDPAIYNVDAPYPTEFARLAETHQMRGVDVTTLGITPFQYNPVMRELTVYTDIEIRVTFEGGNGHFGEDVYRNRYWDPILEANLINYESLPEIEYRAPNSRDTEYEYVIVVPDDPTYIAWADSIQQWRVAQGIDAGVVTLTETGATTTDIENWINNAYTTWGTPPVAILFLADYVSSGGTTGITSPVYNSYCLSDNMYGDIDGDHLPEIVMGRMTATVDNIELLVTKAIDYERNPPTNPGFYQNPIMACGWQDERWFQMCSEIIYGYFANVHGKTPVREYAIYSGTPGTFWSTNPNTYMLEDYFGPDGLGYLPEDSSHLTDWGGNATRLNAAINAGAFILQHRDHGNTTAWGEPDYDIGDMAGLTNTDLTYVFSINCMTGMYGISGECFAEAFHRHEHGALGIIAASESSYSFVNDTYVIGIYDEMWPDFDPGYPVKDRFSEPNGVMRPAFGNASGKHFLWASNWPYNPDSKEVTYHLFHAHGDAFTQLYSEVPEDLTVTHQGVLPIGAAAFSITADPGSIVALTIDGEIIGVADGTGAPMDMTVIPATGPGTMRLTVTKPNYYRYSEDVPVIYPVTYTIVPGTVPVNVTTDVTITVWDDESNLEPDVVITIDGWGIDPVVETTDINGEAVLTITAPYGEDLTVLGSRIGETYNCLSDVLPVTGAADFASADIEASVPSIGLYGFLAPYYEGTITGTASETDFDLFAAGCGIDAAANSGGAMTVDILGTCTETGTVHAAIAKGGFNIYLEDILVDVVYGTISGSVAEDGGGALEGVKIKGYAAAADTATAAPVFEALTIAGGTYVVEDELEIGYYDVYVMKFGYLTHTEEIFIQYDVNDVDFLLDPAPSGHVRGAVFRAGTMDGLSASVKVYRADSGELYTEVFSDSLIGGRFEVSLPYFNYTFKVRAYHYIPETRGVVIDDPSEDERFYLEPTLANILVIQDGGTKDETVKLDKTGSVLDTYDGPQDAAAQDLEADLVGLGYDVIMETAAASDPATWLSYDFILWSTGNSTSPVGAVGYRDALEAYVADEGKLLIEGGELAYDAASYPGYPTFAANVLHVYDWEHDSSGTGIRVFDSAHPLATFPNSVGDIAVSYSGYGDHDSYIPTSDADIVMSWSGYATLASVLVYDDTPDPSSGQIVFYSFNYGAAEATGRMELLENTVTYLLAQESTPDGSLSGTALLAGESNHSGVAITVEPGGASTVTAENGSWLIENFYDGTYTVTATKEDWGTAVVDDVVISAGGHVSGIDFVLTPVTTYQYCTTPELPIPDSSATGVYDQLQFPDDATVAEIEVYLNLSHTYIGDLIVEITSPEGTTVRLHNRSGGSADDILGWYPGELTVNGPGALDDFIGENAMGEWEIWASDNAGGDLGAMHTWCVEVMATSPWTGVDDDFDAPRSYVLGGVAPNPFNPVTTVTYGAPRAGEVELAIYNIAGQRVKT